MRNIYTKTYWLLLSGALLLPVRVFGQPDTGTGVLENPLSVSTIPEFLDKLLAQVVKFSIPIIVVFIIWAGFQFVTAQGNPKKIEDAKNTLQWTLIGAAIILGARLLAAIIAGTITGIGK